MLVRKYENYSMPRRLILLKTLDSMRMEDGQHSDVYLSRLDILVRELTNTGEGINPARTQVYFLEGKTDE